MLASTRLLAAQQRSPYPGNQRRPLAVPVPVPVLRPYLIGPAGRRTRPDLVRCTFRRCVAGQAASSRKRAAIQPPAGTVGATEDQAAEGHQDVRGGNSRPGIEPSVPAPVPCPYPPARPGPAPHMAVHKSIPVVPHWGQALFSPAPAVIHCPRAPWTRRKTNGWKAWGDQHARSCDSCGNGRSGPNDAGP